jgi:hypothetical protein
MGGRFTLTDRFWSDSARPIVLRSGGLSVGYHFAPACPFPRGLGIDLAGETAIGAPALRSFSGLGSYLGASVTPLYRLAGAADFAPTYNIAFGYLDAVATVRGGVWSAPIGTPSPTVGEFGFDLGLRLTLGSDVASAPTPGTRVEEAP